MTSLNKTIHIGGDVNDSTYRYMMRPLKTRIEGNGNGIKTVLTNVVDVAKDIRIRPDYITKFFAFEIGATSMIDDERKVGILNGVHQKKDLQERLKKFIKLFILCPKCDLPELEMNVIQKKKKKGRMIQRCLSCGWKGSNSSHRKLNAYIVRTWKNKKKKKSKKKKKKSNPIIMIVEDDPCSNELEFSDSEWITSEDGLAKRRQEEMSLLASENNIFFDRDSYIETEQKTNKSHFSPSMILAEYISKSDRSTFEILDEIKRIGIARNLDQQRKIQLTLDAICDFSSLDALLMSLKNSQNIQILQHFTRSSESCHILFSCIEEIITRKNPIELLDRSYQILDALYESEIVDEDQILDWFQSPSENSIIVDREEAADVRLKSEPFIQWLQNAAVLAEADEDDSDEETPETENIIDVD